MVLLNFKIEDLTGVSKDNVFLDLHNNFELSEYNYSVERKEFQVVFKKSLGEWAIKEIFQRLIFKFSKVDFVKIRELNSPEFPEDESCLSIIGIATLDMRNDMDSVLDSSHTPLDFDMLFAFEQGQSIKIHSEEVLLETI